MSEIFLAVVNMSISASWLVLAVLILRLLLKKAPRWIHVLLWALVAVRLICPLSVESIMSLIPSSQTVSPQIMVDSAPHIESGVGVIDEVVNPVISQSFTPDPTVSTTPLQIWIPILAAAWVVGMVVLGLYTIISCLRVRKMVGYAVLLRENVYQSETVTTPFVFGFLKPKIYLPFNIAPQDMEYVIAHEQAHIRRRDYLWKPLGFLLLTVHWFNPFAWLGYILLCKDIELACDEKVIRDYTTSQKADYSYALLACSTHRHVITACPLAFGEVSVKDRVKAVLSYKKPAFWIVITAVAAIAVVAVCFLTNPVKQGEKETWTKRVRIDGKWGYVNQDMEYVIEPIYDYLGEFAENGLAVAQVGDLCGYIDRSGNMVIKPQFNGASGFAKNGIARVSVDGFEELMEIGTGRYGYIDSTGQYIVEPQFIEAGSFVDGDLVVVWVDFGQCGLMDGAGNYVLEPRFNAIGQFSENGLAAVKENGLWGYVDRSGAYVIQPRFTTAWSFDEQGMAGVQENGKWGFINRSGEYVIQPQFDNTYGFAENGLAPVKVAAEWGYIDRSGQLVIQPQFDMVEDFGADGLARVRKFQRYGMINERGEYVIEPLYFTLGDFSPNGLAWVTTDYPFQEGYIDRSGQLVILPRFDSAGAFDEEGMACVSIDGKYGFIDETGYYVVPRKYDSLWGFDAEGVAAAKLGDKWGYIDRSGEIVIDFQFDEVEQFSSNGLARVCVDGKYGYINRKGEYVVEPKFDYIEQLTVAVG